MTRGTKPPGASHRAPDVIRLRFQVSSSREAIAEAVRRIMKAASQLRCGRSERADLEIAIREALANAVFHGNRADPAKKVHVQCSLSRTTGMRVAIRDEGSGFDPDAIPDPRDDERLFLHHGRGLFLMRELLDRVEHRNGGREVVLFKAPCTRRRSPSKGAASRHASSR